MFDVDFSHLNVRKTVPKESEGQLVNLAKRDVMKQAWHFEYERMHDITKITQTMARSQICRVDNIRDF